MSTSPRDAGVAAEDGSEGVAPSATAAATAGSPPSVTPPPLNTSTPDASPSSARGGLATTPNRRTAAADTASSPAMTAAARRRRRASLNPSMLRASSPSKPLSTRTRRSLGPDDGPRARSRSRSNPRGIGARGNTSPASAAGAGSARRSISGRRARPKTASAAAGSDSSGLPRVRHSTGTMSMAPRTPANRMSSASAPGSGNTPVRTPKGANEPGNVRVVCRFRPPSSTELSRNDPMCASFLETKEDEIPTTVQIRTKEVKHTFSFDRVFGPDSTQAEVYEYVAKPVVQGLFKGYNGTLFAYGQTGAGKTHTMEGNIDDATLRGIIPRMVDTVFQEVEDAPEDVEFTVQVGMVEIYQEKIRDLLDPTHDSLAIHSKKDGSLYVADLSEVFVTEASHIHDVIRRGAANRSVAATKMNDSSSRSHSVFIMTINQSSTVDQSTKTGKLYLVDLAGSEKVGKTGVKGQQLEEAKNINKSLSALGNVINALTDGRSTHIPYRDSKLTRMLQESLGGNSRTALIMNCSPAAYNVLETVSTLRFGTRAKKIRNKPVVNKERSMEEMKVLVEMKDREISRLHKRVAELEAASTPRQGARRMSSFGSGRKSAVELQRSLDEEEKKRAALEEQLADVIDSLTARVSEATKAAEMKSRSLIMQLETTNQRLESRVADLELQLQMATDEVDALHQASQVAEDMRTAAEKTTSAQIKELEDAKRRLEAQTATLENELAASKSSLEEAQSDAASAREAERSCNADLVAVRADVTLLTQCVVSTASALSDTAAHVVVADATPVTAGAGAGAGSGSGEADADAATSDVAHILADPLASLSDTSAYSEQGVRESSHAIMKLVAQLKGQLEEAEHNEADLSERLHQSSTTLAEVRVRAAETEERLVSETKQLRSELDSSTRRCESAQQEVAALSGSVEEARARVSALETEVEALQNKNEREAMAREAAERLCENLRTASAEQSKHTVASDAQVAALQAELRAARESHDKSRAALDAARSKHAELQGHHNALKDQLRAAESKSESTAHRAALAEADAAAAQASCKELRQQVAALTKELAEAKEAYEVEAEAHHDSHERLLREQDHSSSLEARLAEQQGRHEAEVEKQVAARTHALQERLNGANREVMDLRGQLEDANAKISASETRLHESMAQLNAMDQSVEQRSELESQAVAAARAEADALRAELQQAQLSKDAAVSEARDLSVEIKLLNANVAAAEQRVASALAQVAFYRAQHDQVLSELRDAHEASGSGILGFFKRSDKHSQSSRNIRAALKKQEQALAAVEEAAAADGPPPIDPKILWVSYKQMVVELEKQDHSSSEKMEALELALNDRIHKVAELSQQLDQARDEAKNAVSHRDRHAAQVSRAATKEAEAARLALQRCEVRVSELEAQVRQLELRAQSAESATHLASSAQLIAERRVKLLTERVKALQSAPHVPKAEVSPRRHSKTLRGGGKRRPASTMVQSRSRSHSAFNQLAIPKFTGKRNGDGAGDKGESSGSGDGNGDAASVGDLEGSLSTGAGGGGAGAGSVTGAPGGSADEDVKATNGDDDGTAGDDDGTAGDDDGTAGDDDGTAGDGDGTAGDGDGTAGDSPDSAAARRAAWMASPTND